MKLSLKVINITSMKIFLTELKFLKKERRKNSKYYKNLLKKSIPLSLKFTLLTILLLGTMRDNLKNFRKKKKNYSHTNSLLRHQHLASI
jgi:hypothetical protein